MFHGEMNLKPETKQEIEQCSTPNGIRRRLHEYAYRGSNPLVKAVFDSAMHSGLSGEDTMTVLAFEALKSLEHLQALMLDDAMRRPPPPIIINGVPTDEDPPSLR